MKGLLNWAHMLLGETYFIILGYVLEPCIEIWKPFLHCVEILAIESLKSRFISQKLVL